MALLVWTKLNIIPAVLVGTGLTVAAWGMYQTVVQPDPVRQQSPNPAPAAGDHPDLAKDIENIKASLEQLRKERDVLKERLDSANRDAASAQWLLSMVLLVAGLLTVAQGIFAFFSAQNYVKQADEAVAKAKEALREAETASRDVRSQAKQAIEQVEHLAADVKSKFPLFADIEAARSDAFDELVKLTPGLDLDQNLYAKSDPLTRQRVVAIEAFSAVQFLTPANRSAELVRNLRLLGKFYAGKFLTESFGADFERAYYYIDLALLKSRRHYVALNDLGWLFATVSKPPNVQTAIAYFEESSRQNSQQQRAFYNLGTALFDKADASKLTKAKDFLLQARATPLWEDAPNLQMASHICYNLACVTSTLAGLDGDPGRKAQLLDESMQFLEEAHAKTALRSDTLKPDLVSGGDLEHLAASAQHAPRLQAILAAI